MTEVVLADWSLRFYCFLAVSGRVSPGSLGYCYGGSVAVALVSEKILVGCVWYLSEISCSLRVLLSEVAASVNSMKPVITGPMSEISLSGS